MEKLEILRESGKGILDKLKTNSAGNLPNQINRIGRKDKIQKTKDGKSYFQYRPLLGVLRDLGELIFH